MVSPREGSFVRSIVRASVIVSSSFVVIMDGLMRGKGCYDSRKGLDRIGLADRAVR